jgi:hypothetical protein
VLAEFTLLTVDCGGNGGAVLLLLQPANDIAPTKTNANQIRFRMNISSKKSLMPADPQTDVPKE